MGKIRIISVHSSFATTAWYCFWPKYCNPSKALLVQLETKGTNTINARRSNYNDFILEIQRMSFLWILLLAGRTDVKTSFLWSV